METMAGDDDNGWVVVVVFEKPEFMIVVRPKVSVNPTTSLQYLCYCGDDIVVHVVKKKENTGVAMRWRCWSGATSTSLLPSWCRRHSSSSSHRLVVVVLVALSSLVKRSVGEMRGNSDVVVIIL